MKIQEIVVSSRNHPISGLLGECWQEMIYVDSRIDGRLKHMRSETVIIQFIDASTIYTSSQSSRSLKRYLQIVAIERDIFVL